ncbi:MAG: putative zinc-binding peptidase [Caldilineaceae bacterium]|nr:putative zinc-binding peptidase [Caldilineaceae bacterium]
MRLFTCQNCGQLLYFENTVCEKCGHALGYLAAENDLLTLTPAQNDQWFAAAAPAIAYRYCANVQYGACNWLIAAEATNPFCTACQLNGTIPDLSRPTNLTRWKKIEAAKHRLVYSLLQLGLPVVNKTDDGEFGLRFDFLADADNGAGGEQQVTTGHADGLITMNIAEADDANRERIRQSLAEPYRTLLGHFRHEIAHYYWMRFARSQPWLASFRQTFGDERTDYGEALAQHYDSDSTAADPDASWRETYISAYAEVHPWEDWAETWAHYFHIVDTLETAYVYGIQIHPKVSADDTLATEMHFNAYQQADFDALIAAWLPVTYAVNSLNRAMGQPDLYPFVLTAPVLQKMAFIHNSIRAGIDAASATSS